MFGNKANSTLSGKKNKHQHVFPLDYQADQVSQLLVEASHDNNLNAAYGCLADPFVDVNFVGIVSLRAKKTEIVLRDESAHGVRVEYDEFKTEVTALFLAAHVGNLTLVNKLLSVGAQVNQKLFRGFATTAALREGHLEILQTLISAGAGQQACEEALMEASLLGCARPAEMLMATELVRPRVAVHALVSASCRGFIDVVDTLIKCGVDADATDRILLQSSKPSLHVNVDCCALFAAVVSRQVSVVSLLLQAGVKLDTNVRLGAWSWDMDTGEEIRVGSGLAEPYGIIWCAVEYFEASGAILRMLLHHLSPNDVYLGRTLIHHAILCNNARAVKLLLSCGADLEIPMKTTSKLEFRAIHLAARLGLTEILQCLIRSGCNVNSQTGCGETGVMICARYKYEECLKILISAGADLGMVNSAGQSVSVIAKSRRWFLCFKQAIRSEILAGNVPQSSNVSIFSPLMFITQENDVEALKKLIEQRDINLDQQNDDGYTAIMIAAAGAHLESFKLLLYAGANITLHNKYGETANSLSELKHNCEAFEKVMLEYELEQGQNISKRSSALHRATLRGDIDLVRALTSSTTSDINVLNCDGYTPLMLAARRGYSNICEVLITYGAEINIQNTRHETALLLAGKNGCADVILDSLALRLVLSGAGVKKHTKSGKGSPHFKKLRMVDETGILSWGKSSWRNVVCKGAEVGPSEKFRWNRRNKLDAEEPGMFHVVTMKNKEGYQACD
ncbi:hypothetical protein ACFE04_025355 [Oxalis oulophora]